MRPGAARLAGAAVLGMAFLVLAGAQDPGSEPRPCKVVGWMRDTCSGRPIPFATLVVADSAGGRGAGGMADTSGWFDIRCGCGPKIVRALALAYEWKRFPVSLEPARVETLRIELMSLRFVPEDTVDHGPLPRGAVDLSHDVFRVSHRDSCP